MERRCYRVSSSTPSLLLAAASAATWPDRCCWPGGRAGPAGGCQGVSLVTGSSRGHWRQQRQVARQAGSGPARPDRAGRHGIRPRGPARCEQDPGQAVGLHHVRRRTLVCRGPSTHWIAPERRDPHLDGRPGAPVREQVKGVDHRARAAPRARGSSPASIAAIDRVRAQAAPSALTVSSGPRDGSPGAEGRSLRGDAPAEQSLPDPSRRAGHCPDAQPDAGSPSRAQASPWTGRLLRTPGR